MANQDRDINFRIRATDQSATVMRGAAKNVDVVTDSLDRQAAAAGKASEAAAQYYNRVLNELGTAQEKALAARREFEAMREEMAGQEAPTKAQERALNGLAKAADSADKAVGRLKDKLATADLNLEARRGDQKQAENQAAYVRDLTRALDEAESVANLGSFRRIGEDAVAGARGVRDFAAAARTADDGADQMATALRRIIDPSSEAIRSLDGLENEVAQLSAFVGQADRPLREYQDAIYALQRAQMSAVGQAGMIDSFRQQEAAVEAAVRKFQAARAEVLQYGNAVRTAEAPNAELVSSLRQAEAALGAAGGAVTREVTKLAQLQNALKRASINVDELGRAEQRLKNSTDQATQALTRLDNAAKGQGAGGGRFLGLRPYEMQNLAYQINDVFTQLASGASVTQTFAQQGGQILQLFPGLFSRILAFGPILLGVAAVAGTAIASISRVLDYQTSVREFSADLALSADGARYQASGLAQAAHELDVYGDSLKDAKAALSSFVQGGFDQSQFVELGKTAQDLSDVIGVSLPEAAAMMSDAFSGGMAQVDELDAKLNFLSATERERIQDLFDSGEAEAARTEALRIFREKAEEAANNQRGPWSEAARNLAGAWDTFLGVVGNTKPVQDAINALNGLARVVQWVTSLLPGGSTASVAQRGAQFAQAQAQKKLGELQAMRTEAAKRTPVQQLLFGPSVDNIDRAIIATSKEVIKQANAVKTAATQASQARLKAGQRLIDQEQRALNQSLEGAGKLTAAERLRAAEVEARRKAQAVNATKEQEDQLASMARQREQIQIDKQAEAAAKKAGRAGAAAQRKAEAEARKAAAAAKREQAQRESMENQLLNDMRSMDVRVARAQRESLEQRLATVDTQYEKIFDRIREYEAAGGKEIKGVSIADFSAEVNANKEALKQQEQLKFYEESISDLEEQREATLSRINDEIDAGNKTAQAGYDEARAAQADLNPQIAALATQAADFAASIAGAKPSPQMLAFIEQMRSIATGATLTNRPSSADNQFGLQQLARQQRELNEVISTRNDLVSAANTLLERGIITQAEFENRARSAYEGTEPLIQKNVAAVLDLAESLRAAGGISETTFAKIKADLEATAIEARYVSEEFLRIRGDLTGSFVNGAVTAFDTVGQSLANLIRGGQGFKATFNDIFTALRTWAANFLLDIARMILQMTLLQALQNSPFFNGLATGIQTFVNTGSLTAAAAAMQVAAASTATAGTTVAAGATALSAAGATTAAAGGALATGGAAVTAAGASITAGAAALGVSAAALQAAATTLAVANATGIGLFHSGGVVGSVRNRVRQVSPLAFLNAPRYHTGGISGFKPDERAAILRKGEEVLTEEDPRHRNNGGLTPSPAAAPETSLRIINAFDAEDMIQRALEGRRGEKVILNFIRNNARAVQGALNSK